MELRRAGIKDACLLWELQREAFAGLLAKYQDYDTNPGNESLERIEEKLRETGSYFYMILEKDKIAGAIRIVDRKDGARKRISPLFILGEYRNRGCAQSAIIEAERIHGEDNWALSTILQEIGNCYLYEKMGYHRTGQTEAVNDKMTIVYYEKN